MRLLSVTFTIAFLLGSSCTRSAEEGGEKATTPPLKNHEIIEKDGMVFVPAGLVALGPRKLSAVAGWTPPANVTGQTPNAGTGNNQRDAGGPPLPGIQGRPPQHQGGRNRGNNQHNGGKHGVGHVRPGSGVPSTPPNMPGNQAKNIGGDEQIWTANPGNQMEVKTVSVSEFWIDKTEVTRKQYKEFLDATKYRPPFVDETWADDGWNWNGTDYPAGTGDHPVIMINFYDAEEFCSWKGKRLPTESEWQMAALGDAREGRTYPWGKEYNHDVHNHGKIEAPNFDDSDGYLTTSPVTAFPKGASPFGALDMFGNAWEYTSDYRRSSWDFYTATRQGADVAAPGPGLYVAVRGGAYFFDLRPFPGGERNEFLPELRRKTSGFRCAK